MKFKIGDLVRVKQEKVSDLDSDMRMDLADRTLSGRRYDRLMRTAFGK